VTIDDVVFPNTFIEHLMFRNVFFTDSSGIKHKVHFKILNTTEYSLEKFFENVDTAVVGTRLRHRERILEIQARQRFYASGCNKEAHLAFLPLIHSPMASMATSRK
jgi:hypothetical protein